MGRTMSYERALEVYRDWKKVQERKKQRKQEQEKKRLEEIKRQAEIRKKREKKLEEQRKKEEEKREKKEWERARTIDMSDWILKDSGDLYTEYELRHIEELYPREKGRINWELFDNLIKQARDNERNKEENR